MGEEIKSKKLHLEQNVRVEPMRIVFWMHVVTC